LGADCFVQKTRNGRAIISRICAAWQATSVLSAFSKF
jgi:hypothetical protein